MGRTQSQMKEQSLLFPEWFRWGLSLGTWLAYAILAFALHNKIEPVLSAMSIFPVVVTSWYFGFAGSLFGIALSVFLNAYLLITLYDYSWVASITSRTVLSGDIVLVLVALVIGYASHRTRLQRQELVEREALDKERRAYTEFLALLNNITQAALETEDLPTMLQTLADRMGDLFGTDNSFITLWDDEQKLTKPVAAFGPQSSAFMSVQFEPGESTLTEHVLSSGQALSIFDITTSPYVNPQKAPKVYQGSLLVLPLMAGKHKLGAAFLAHNSHYHFTENEISRGEMAARHISLALSKGYLLEDEKKQAKQQATLLQLSTDLATQLDEKAICQLVVNGLHDHDRLGFVHVGVFLVDEATGERVLRAGTSIKTDDNVVRIPPGRGLSERPLLDGQLHYTPDVKAQPGWVFYSEGDFLVGGCEVDVPIKIGDQVEGVLTAENNCPNAFDQSDLDVLSAVANLAGLALTRSRLVSTERKQFDELMILHTLAMAITEATDEDEIIERATSIIGENLFPDNFGILLVDEGIGALRVHPSYWIKEEILEEGITVPFGQGVVGSVYETGVPERIPDVSLIPHFLDVDSKTRSELAVPLKIGERIIGVINAESNKLNGFSEADERILVTMAGQLATAIENARLFEETQSRLREQILLREAGTAISSALDTQTILDRLVEKFCLAIDATSAYINEYNDQAEEYTVVAECISEKANIREKESDLGETYPLRSDNDENKFFVNMNSGQYDVSHFDNLELPVSEREHMQEYGGKSILYVPLIIKDKLVGIVELWESRYKRDFSTEEINLCLLLAQQAAIGIENARLFEEVKQLATIDELTGLNNRRHFDKMANSEFNRAKRYGRVVSAMMLDIDHFKDFNDKYGHAVGDQVLQAIAKLCDQSLRDADILGRYGGEEFVILLPETKRDTAKTVAERIRKRICEALIPTEKGDLSVTISIGVAENNEHTPTLETLIARADQAMYVAKHKGRNQVAVGY